MHALCPHGVAQVDVKEYAASGKLGLSTAVSKAAGSDKAKAKDKVKLPKKLHKPPSGTKRTHDEAGDYGVGNGTKRRWWSLRPAPHWIWLHQQPRNLPSSRRQKLASDRQRSCTTRASFLRKSTVQKWQRL